MKKQYLTALNNSVITAIWGFTVAMGIKNHEEVVLSFVYRAISIPLGLYIYGQIVSLIKGNIKEMVKIRVVKRNNDKLNPPSNIATPFDKKVGEYRWYFVRLVESSSLLPFFLAFFNPKSDPEFVLTVVSIISVIIFSVGTVLGLKFQSYLDKQDEYLRSWALESKS